MQQQQQFWSAQSSLESSVAQGGFSKNALLTAAMTYSREQTLATSSGKSSRSGLEEYEKEVESSSSGGVASSPMSSRGASPIPGEHVRNRLSLAICKVVELNK